MISRSAFRAAFASVYVAMSMFKSKPKPKSMLSQTRQYSSCLAILALVIMSSSACHSSHSNDDTGSSSDQQKISQLLESPESLDYTHIKTFVLEKYCSSCHNEKDRKDNINVMNYDALVKGGVTRSIAVPYNANASLIYQSLILPTGRRHMPPLDQPQLQKYQIELVRAWVDNGAKEKSDMVTPTPLKLSEELRVYFENPESIDYSVVQEYVFKNNCTKCHSEHSEQAETEVLANSANLTNYKTIFNRFNPVVVKGVEEESKIFKAVAIRQSMPPVKEGYELLDGNLIKLLRLWISNCAIEDLEVIKEDRLEYDPNSPEKVRLCEGQ